MGARKACLGIGIGALVTALPVGYASFTYLAGIICNPADCYGEPAWLPLGLALLLTLALASIGISLIEANILAYSRKRMLTRLAWLFIAGAFPLGYLSGQGVANSYCGTSCSGDHIVMGMVAMLTGIVVAAISLGLSVVTFTMADRPTGKKSSRRAARQTPVV